MAAGLGFKTFTTGEVLTAGDVNGYLMQGVLVFASAAARDAAITSPQEGQFAYTKDTNGLWYYDGAAWVASGATGDIEGVTAGIGISGGGTSGTVTVTNSMATAIDAKGDLVAGTAADTFARLAVGANDTVLTADSTAATGLKWATAAAGGMTSIASGSLPTGTTTLTISSIPTTYNQLLLQINNVSGVSASNILRVRINNISTASSYGAENDGYISLPNLTAIQFNGTNNTFDATAAQIFAQVSFVNYAATNAVKIGNFLYGNTADDVYTDGFWIQKTQNTTAITRIDVISSNANFQTGGTYTLWGIK